MIFSLQSDESSLSGTKTGVGTFTKKAIEPDKASYSICGILEIPADQKISLYIYLTSQEKYKILNGSRVSVTTNQQTYQAFHVTLKNSVILIFVGHFTLFHILSLVCVLFFCCKCVHVCACQHTCVVCVSACV